MPTMKSRDINQKYSTYLKCQPIICVCVPKHCILYTRARPHSHTHTHTKHHRMIKINYIINLIIGPNENVCVCVFIFDFFVVVHTKLKAFYAWMGCVFLCVCVYVFFCCFPFPPSKHIKSSRLLFSQIIWPTSFGPHIHSFLHSDCRYHIRMGYASGENIFDAVILLFDKFQRKPMVRKWQHAHTQHTHTHYTDTHNTINSMCMDFCSFIRSNRNKMWKTENSGYSHGGRNYKEKKTEQSHIFEQIAFWLFSSSVRSVSRMMMSMIFFFLLLFAWVYESWKNILWSSQCDRTYSAKNQANQNEKATEMCIWNRIKHIHTKAKLQTLYASIRRRTNECCCEKCLCVWFEGIRSVGRIFFCHSSLLISVSLRILTSFHCCERENLFDGRDFRLKEEKAFAAVVVISNGNEECSI